MLRQAFLLTFLTIGVVAAGLPGRKFRIVGGFAANRVDVPFQLAYIVDNDFRCGGVIISHRVAITAAHCIEKGDLNSYVIGGSSTVKGLYNGEGVARSVVRIILHEEFVDKEGDYDNDIALLFVKYAFKFNRYIHAATLPLENEDYQYSTLTAIVSGWGSEREGGELPSHLKYTIVNLVPRDVCILEGGDIGKNVICAGSEDGSRDACGGDSGGPLFIGNKVIGLVSFGWPCGQNNRPAAYTDIAKLRGWIYQHSGV